MSIDLTGLAEVMERLASENGGPVTFARNASTVNTSTGAVTAGITTTATGYAVQVPASKGTIEAFDNRTEKDSKALKRMRALKVTRLSGSFIPQPDDVCTWGSVSWRVLGSTPAQPDGSTTIALNVGLVEL